MRHDTQVVADGLDQRVESKPALSRWTLLTVGFVVAAAIVLVFTGEPEEPEPPAEPATNAARVVPNASPSVTDIAMSEAVRGFPDALVSVTLMDTGAYQFLIWPRDGSLFARAMTGGDAAAFDSDSQIIAIIDEIPGLDSVVLSTGRHTQIRPAVPQATSFAWHDTASGHLSYTTDIDGEWSLWRLYPNLRSDLIATGIVPGGRVVAWGDWGWAVQAPDGDLMLFTPDGDLKTAHPGTAYASRGDGWLFVVGDQPQLVSAGGGVQWLDIDLDGLGDLRHVSFSNDGERIALAGSQATRFYELDGDAISDFRFQVRGHMKFSSDDRFVVAPAPTGVVVFDLQRETRAVVLEQYRVLATSVVPVAGS